MFNQFSMGVKKNSNTCKPIMTIAVMFTIVVTMISGCAADEKPDIVMRAMLEPASLDIQANVSMESGFIGVHVFERLMEYDKNGQLRTGILEKEPEVSQDGHVYHFKLKSGLRFSDGSPLTSEDVRYTIVRALKPETGGWNSWIFDSIDGATEIIEGKSEVLKGFKVLNDREFEVRLSHAYVPFINGLASPYAGIIPSDLCESLGEEWGKTIIGSGPYIVKEWLPGQSLTLERNSIHAGKRGAYDKIVNVFSDDFQQNMAGFRTGALDQIPVPAEEYEVVSTDESLKDRFVSVPALNIHYMGINLKNPILKDARVREAISLAIDRERLCSVVLKDAAVPAHTFLPPGILGYDANARIPFDPERARRLLDEAGYPDGFELDYACQHIIEADYAIKSMLEQVGIHLKIRKITHEERLKSLKEGTHTMILKYWWADIPDGDNFIYNKFNSKYSRYVEYLNDRFDTMSEDARVEVDQGKRSGLYQELDHLLCSEDWVVVPLYHVKESTLVSPAIKGFYIDPVTSIPMFP